MSVETEENKKKDDQEQDFKRKGNLLEDQAESIFRNAGFDVSRNVKHSGYEIDLLVSFGDRRIIVECKQYERSYLPVRNLIFQWKGKNEILNADAVILLIYGVKITEEEHVLANESGIQIWDMSVFDEFYPFISNRDELCRVILRKLDLEERDIVETNQIIMKELIWKAYLKGEKSVKEEEKYKVFRKALRHRIITNLKEFGSTFELRSKHIDFFENVIKETETKKKFIIFKVELQLSQKAIWDDTKKKLKELNPFPEEINRKYLDYITRLEEGFDEINNWFFDDPGEVHNKVVYERIYGLSPSECAQFTPGEYNKSIWAENFSIKLNARHVNDINLLQWILTDLNYEVFEEFGIDGGVLERYLIWNTNGLDETTEYVCRVLYEYFGVEPKDQLYDGNLTNIIEPKDKSPYKK